MVSELEELQKRVDRIEKQKNQEVLSKSKYYQTPLFSER